jgi:hypothetical protein
VAAALPGRAALAFVDTKMGRLLRLHNSRFRNAAMQQEHGENVVYSGT